MFKYFRPDSPGLETSQRERRARRRIDLLSCEAGIHLDKLKSGLRVAKDIITFRPDRRRRSGRRGRELPSANVIR